MKKPTLIIIFAVFGIVLQACVSKNRSTQKIDSTKERAVVKKDSTHLFGMWLDDEIKTDKGEQVAYQIVTQGPKTYIQVITFKEKKLNVDDNPAIAPSASLVKKTGKNRYVSVDNASEIYLIEKAGDLLIYDQTGFIAKCKRML